MLAKRNHGVDDVPQAEATGDLAMPPELRVAVESHLSDVKKVLMARGRGRRVGFGERPALLVIDLAKAWVDRTSLALGSDLESVVAATCELLSVAREAEIPIFFTTMAYGEDDPITPHRIKKVPDAHGTMGSEGTRLDPRLQRLPSEKLIVKKYASCFKGTDLQEMLGALRVDTVIVTGCSTSHCVYATCRDAASSLNVIVPIEAVGDRSELSHMVFLQDIDLALGDTMATADVARNIREMVVRD